MTFRPELPSLCLSLLIAVSGRPQVQDLPGATVGHGGFAFPDQRGSRLMLMPALAQPELLKTALCTGGHRLPAQFTRRQATRDGGNGRQSPGNFDSLAGSVFSIATEKVDRDAMCFLASDALLAGSTQLSVTAPDGSGACTQRDRFATLRDRPVIRCSPLAGLGSGKYLALIEFERRGKDALASVVYVDGARTIFADYPAEFRGAGQDIWRVDDGGVLTPEVLKVVFMLQREGWYALGVAWAGAEGQSLSLWISEGGDRFAQVIRDYWYRAPI